MRRRRTASRRAGEVFDLSSPYSLNQPWVKVLAGVCGAVYTFASRHSVRLPLPGRPEIFGTRPPRARGALSPPKVLVPDIESRDCLY